MKNFLIVIAMMLLLVSSGFAQNETGGKAGQVYLGLNLNSGEQFPGEGFTIGSCPFGISLGSTSDNSGNSATFFIISMTTEVGYFIADGFNIGLALFSQISWVLSDDPVAMLGPGIEIGYIFDTGAVSPFIQLNAQFLLYPFGKSLFIGFKVMPLVGLKFFLNSMVALDLAGFFSYSMFFEQDTATPDELTNIYGGVRFGVDLFL